MRNLPQGFEIHLVSVKTMRKIAHIFVAFSEKLNFNRGPLKALHDTKSILNHQGGSLILSQDQLVMTEKRVNFHGLKVIYLHSAIFIV